MLRIIRRALLAGTLLALATAGTVAADHSHVRKLGNGACVILAPDAGEEAVQLPFAGSFPSNRQHPLHVLVHLGTAGEERVWVQGSSEDLANCAGYVNAAADRAP